MAETLFRMPSLGADMEAGTLVGWNVKPGDRVRRGDVVAVVETHKGAIDVEIFHDGVVARLLVAEGEKVPVGTPLAALEEEAGAEQPAVPGASGTTIPPKAPEPAPAPTPVAPTPQPVAPTPVAPPPAPPTPAPGAWVRSSPAARWAARERGLDLASIPGTGPHGAVRRPDVERAWAARQGQAQVAPTPTPSSDTPPAPAARPAGPDPNAAIRQAIAAAMTRSNREIPTYYLAHDVDLSAPLARLAAANAARPPTARVLPGALLVWATARALQRFPEMNGTYEEGAFRPGAGVHPGLAIALRGGGLVTPALHDADQKSPEQIMAAMQDLVARARAGRLRSSEWTDATITITSLGDQGVEAVFGVIYPPQVALVGFGRIADRPVAVGGMLGVRPVVTVTLAGDHRVSDGHRGALFLKAIDQQLQEAP